MEYVTEVLEGRAQVSSFQEVEVKEHVTLLPSYLGKVAKGVIELLCSRVLLYNTLYNGVLLTFSHVKIINSVGHIVDELPHIHIDVLYTATVFRPQVGQVMCGQVNKVGVDHIGCLLYNCFNVSIVCTGADPLNIHGNQASRASEGLKSSRLSKIQRRTLRSWCNQRFAEGEGVWFSVSSVEVTGSILSVKGEYIAVDVMRREGGGGGEGGEGGEVVEEVPVNGLNSSMMSDDSGTVDNKRRKKKHQSEVSSTTGGKRRQKRKKSSTDLSSDDGTRAAGEEAGGEINDISQSGCRVEEAGSSAGDVRTHLKLKARRKHKH